MAPQSKRQPRLAPVAGTRTEMRSLMEIFRPEGIEHHKRRWGESATREIAGRQSVGRGRIGDHRRARFQYEDGRVGAQIRSEPNHASAPGARGPQRNFLENMYSGFVAKLAEIDDGG